MRERKRRKGTAKEKKYRHSDRGRKTDAVTKRERQMRQQIEKDIYSDWTQKDRYSERERRTDTTTEREIQMH
jgi:hypothetical protein